MAEYTYSVVIPHYNSPKLLARMLKSIPERNDIQIIVVDDCSPKEAQDELMQLQHKGLEVVLQTENHGAGYARNVGLGKIKGEWCIFVDADDFFAVNTFEVFDKHVECNIDYINFAISFYNINEDKYDYNPPSFSNQSVLRFLKDATITNCLYFKLRNTVCYNKLVKASFLREKSIRFEEVPVNNDVFYALQVGLLSKYYKVIKECLYHKLIVNSSITNRKRDIHREYLFFIQAIKRNGLSAMLGLYNYPFYRSEFLYIPHLIKKRGVSDTLRFFKYRWQHNAEVKEAYDVYRNKFNSLTRVDIENMVNYRQ